MRIERSLLAMISNIPTSSNGMSPRSDIDRGRFLFTRQHDLQSWPDAGDCANLAEA